MSSCCTLLSVYHTHWKFTEGSYNNPKTLGPAWLWTEERWDAQLVIWEELLALVPEMSAPLLPWALLCPGPAHSSILPFIQLSYRLLSAQPQAELRWSGKDRLIGWPLGWRLKRSWSFQKWGEECLQEREQHRQRPWIPWHLTQAEKVFQRKTGEGQDKSSNNHSLEEMDRGGDTQKGDWGRTVREMRGKARQKGTIGAKEGSISRRISGIR